MPDDKAQEKVLDKQSETATKAHKEAPVDLISARKEAAENYKKDMEQRKSGSRIITSSQEALKGTNITITDGGKGVGASPAESMRAESPVSTPESTASKKSMVIKDSQGRIAETVDANSQSRQFKYGPDGTLIEFTDGTGKWSSTDGKHWEGQGPDGQPRTMDAQVQVSNDGSFTIQTERGTTVSKPDGTTERTAADKSVIVEGTNGKIEKTVDANGKERTFGYGADGRINKVTEEDGSTWSSSDGHMWTTPDGRWWKGTIKLENDGSYRYIDANDKETIKRPDGTKTVKETNGRIVDTLPDGTSKVVQEEIDRKKLNSLAEDLHDGDDVWGVGGSIDSGRQNREKLLWNGELFDRLKNLNQAEREALKGIYHQKYGKTLDEDYSFLEGKDKEKFDALMHKDSDPTAQKADRLMAAIDKSYSDYYSSFSYRNTDRKNANREIRETLKSMNSDEIKDLDRHFRKVYGVSLQDAIKKDTPKATREMCDIYLKGSDKMTSQDHVRLGELEEAERREVDGVPNPSLKSANVKALFEKNFDALDKDKDGRVDQEEIDRAMRDSDFKGEDAQLIGLLKHRRAELALLNDDDSLVERTGITKKDIEKLSEIANKSEKSQEEKDLVNGIDSELHHSGRKLRDGNRNLWGVNGNNPIDSITPAAVDQERVGDCYFLAAVGSMAATPEGKQQLKNMIEDNGDGTYTVTFPDDPKHPVTINEPTQAELAHGAAPNEAGIWVAVLEKAYGKYHGKQTDEPTTLASDGIGHGGSPADCLRLLSGRDSRTDELVSTSKEDTHNRLASAMRDGRPIVADALYKRGELPEWADGERSRFADLPAPHSYTVTGYDPVTRTVTIVNPHGYGGGEPKNSDGTPVDGNPDGTFKMSLDDFYENFDEVHYVRSRSDMRQGAESSWPF